MDTVGNLVTTCPLQMGWEISIALYPSRWFRWIDNMDPPFGNGLVWTWTRTRCDGQEPLLTPEMARSGSRRVLHDPIMLHGRVTYVSCLGPAPMSGSSMADRWLILRSYESIPLTNKMGEEFVWVVTRALFMQEAAAHVRIMNTIQNAMCTITAIAHLDPTAQMALLYQDIISNAARSVHTGVIDMEGNEWWERLQIHRLWEVKYMAKGTEGLQNIREEMQAATEGVMIPAQVRWLSNPQTIRESKQRGEIMVSSVVFIARGKKVTQRLLNTGVAFAGESYKVEPYTNTGSHRLCELRCDWGHMKSKCSHHQPKCGYCARPHRSDEPRCNGVGCSSRQGASCSHMQETCLNCSCIHIAFTG